MDADQHASAPLIVSGELAAATQSRFEAERERHFPAGRTAVGAHLTLFHALPAALRAELLDTLEELRGMRAPEVEVRGVRSLGRGVAYDLSSPGLEELRASWAERWAAHLTAQDAQAWRPHVTVQNKVEPAVARRTLADLERGFEPWTTVAVAVRVWRYDGGPWTPVAEARLEGPG